MSTKKTYTPIIIEIERLEMDVMSVSQPAVDTDPFIDDIYFK